MNGVPDRVPILTEAWIDSPRQFQTWFNPTKESFFRVNRLAFRWMSSDAIPEPMNEFDRVLHVATIAGQRLGCSVQAEQFSEPDFRWKTCPPTSQHRKDTPTKFLRFASELIAQLVRRFGIQGSGNAGVALQSSMLPNLALGSRVGGTGWEKQTHISQEPRFNTDGRREET
jgi:hypothetical protein